MVTECFICGENNENVLQSHHIVPKRHGGSDSEENVVRLCANCHQAVERLYDRRFYQTIKQEFREKSSRDTGNARTASRDLRTNERKGSAVRRDTVVCPYCGEPQYALKNHVRLESGGGHGSTGDYPDDDQWVEALS